MKIYRLKLRQRRLENTRKHAFHYFPFDNVYFVPTNQASISKRLFRYCLIIDVDSALRSVIKDVVVQKHRVLEVPRRDSIEWVDTVKGECATDFLNKGDWTMLVPTYARVDKRTKVARLIYTLSDAVSGMHNINAHLPGVKIQTPQRTVPAICALCAHAANYYANKCSPRRRVCANNIALSSDALDLPTITDIEDSIRGAGEVK